MDDGATPPGSSEGGRRPRAAGEDDWIRSQLRRVYDATVGEQIPDEMMDLLRQLDQVSAPSDFSGGSDIDLSRHDCLNGSHDSEGPR